jgi:ribosomal protein L22
MADENPDKNPDKKNSKSKKMASKKTTKAKAPAKKAPKEGSGKKAAPKTTAAKKPAKAKKAPEKKAEPKPNLAPIVVRASSRYVRIAPRKARLIADQVRGLQIDKARALLQFSPRAAAHDIRKLIDSAAANAENNHDLIADEMRVSEITVDEGPTLKRFRPRAQGRATPIHKRTSHIAVALSPEED